MDVRRKWSPSEDALLVKAYRVQASSRYHFWLYPTLRPSLAKAAQ
jgi:hypothetical protein